ncbi:MAG: DUF418 domain-containing protein [Psychrosphaera sp.]|nr:DUF418 domain-containing protein [Psychrosphaera sp.]
MNEQNPAAAAPSGNLAPISESKRIDIMDMLRGFALIGIILMNVEWFSRSITGLGLFDFDLSGGDWSAGWLIRLFVEGKFYKLFCLLFGMGFAVMLIRAQEVGRPFGAWFTRRMFFLFLFGIAHMIFLWPGDIVHDYAFGGLLLLGWVSLLNSGRMKRLNNSASFLRVGLVMLCVPMVLTMLAGIFFGSTTLRADFAELYDNRVEVAAAAEKIKLDPIRSSELIAKAKADKEAGTMPEVVDEDAMEDQEKLTYRSEQHFLAKHAIDKLVEEEKAALTTGSYWQVTQYRLEETGRRIITTPIFGLFFIFPLFMVGYWFIASGVLRAPKEHLVLFKSMALIGGGFGTFISIAGLLILAYPAAEHGMELQGIGGTLFFMGQLLMTAGYLGAIVLLSLTERGHRWLGCLAPMGRMALTNYILNSLVLSSIFYGYAGGLYGEISRSQQVGVVVVILVVQAVFSALWLKYFRFGPLEWLWRSLTYLKVQPMRV